MRTAGCIAAAALSAIALSCSDSRKVAGVVEDFMEANGAAWENPSVRVVRVDSTYHVTPARVERIRAAAERSGAAKPGAGYAPPTRKLVYAVVEYGVGGGQARSTFYLDADMERVVAFMP